MSLTLFGISLPANRRLAYALLLIPGLGLTRSNELCRILGVAPSIRVRDLTQSQEKALAQELKENYIVAGHLEEERKADLHRILNNGSQRGHRIRLGLPVRGQRTHSNAKTANRLRGRKALKLKDRWLSGLKHRS
jgi:small subunit ribosomal protein S13